MPTQLINRTDRLLSIGEVARTTGITEVNLRVWERRYGFPNPNRGANGDRQYSLAHLEWLQLVKGLLQLSYRPSEVICLRTDELMLLSGKARTKVVPSVEDQPAVFRVCLDLVKVQSGAKLRSRLSQELLSRGLRNFVISVAAPLTKIVSLGRNSDQFTVLEKYLFTATLESIIRGAIISTFQSGITIEARPRVLLATAPPDRSILELLLVEALFTLEGTHCTSLGLVRSLKEVATIGRGHEVDIVVVAFSHKISPRSIVENVRKLQSELGDKLRILIDANLVALVGRKLGFGCIFELESIVDAVGKLRGGQGKST